MWWMRWFVHISFVSMVKFESLAPFPKDPLSYPVMPGLILFAALTHMFNISPLSPHYLQVLFLIINTRFGWLAMVQWSVCIPESLKILWVSFSRTKSALSIYHLLVGLNYFNLLHSSQWIIFPTQPCLVLYSVCTSCLYN